jgi:hypothetical protein
MTGPQWRLAMLARLSILCGSAALFSGCARSELIEVSGQVTFDGKPVETGEIIFHPVDTSLTPAGGRIRGGQYKLLTKPGKMRVDIQAVRKTGKRDPLEGFEITELYIPPRYNAETELTAEVTPDGENRFDFPLTKD